MASFQKVAVIGTFAALQGCGEAEPEKQTVQADGKTILDDMAQEVQEVIETSSNYMKGRKIQNVQDFKAVFTAATKKLPTQHKEVVESILKTLDASVKDIVNNDSVKQLPSTISEEIEKLQKDLTDEKVKETLSGGLKTFEEWFAQESKDTLKTEEAAALLKDLSQANLATEKKVQIMAAFESYGDFSDDDRKAVDKKIAELKTSKLRGIAAPCTGEQHKYNNVKEFRDKVIDTKNPDIITIKSLAKFIPFEVPKGAEAELQKEIIQEVSTMLRHSHAKSTDVTEIDGAKYFAYVRSVHNLQTAKAEVKPAKPAVKDGKKGKKEKKEKK